MTIGPHPFGDDRLSLYVVQPAVLVDRLARTRAALGGTFTDLLLPRSSGPELRGLVLQAGFTGAGLWVADDGLGPSVLASRTLDDLRRTRLGFLELNVESPADHRLPAYVAAVVAGIRTRKPRLRIRLNVRHRKATFLPLALLRDDPQLFAAEQCYVDPPGTSMVPTSAADALRDLLDHGVPPAKAAVCYGAAGPVGGRTGAQRVATVPVGWRIARGVVFQDDLLAEVGLL